MEMGRVTPKSAGNWPRTDKLFNFSDQGGSGEEKPVPKKQSKAH